MSEHGGRGRPRIDRYEVERTLAPHVEPAWAEAAILELRLLGVSGERVGAALAEVDAHCVDSGEPAAEAFGDPVAYARSLELPGDDASRAGVAVAALPSVLQTFGMLAVLWSVPALRRGEAVDVSTGAVGMLLMFGAVVAVIVVWSTPVLRLVVARPLVALAAGAGAIAATVTPLLLGRGTLVSTPGWLTLLTGVVALGVGVVWDRHRAGRDASPLVIPNEPPPRWHGGRVVELVAAWQAPVMTALLAVVLWFAT